MANYLTRIQVKNFRSLADVSVETRALNVLIGPNGSGKSSFLDAIWFVRDCAYRGVDAASSARSHGVGVLWDGAGEADIIAVTLSTRVVEYRIQVGFSEGRFEPRVGELLRSADGSLEYIKRETGSDKARFFHANMKETMDVPLWEPQRLSLSRYVDFESELDETFALHRLLRYVHFYHSRSFMLHRIKHQGSEASHEMWLWDRAENLWSVLRNLNGKRRLHRGYDTIIDHMRQAFPGFDDLVLEQTGPMSVYASILEKDRRKPILASGVSDGHLQLLILLAALFSEGEERDSILIFDEPELSLHAKALVVLASAFKLAASQWNKQIFIATHSPVLMSQFEPSDVLATSVEDGQTKVRRVSELTELRGLVEHYALGSLYMAGELAPQEPVLAPQEPEHAE